MSERPRVNLTNVTRGVEMIKYEIHLQDVRIKELENLLVLKNQEISKLKGDITNLDHKYSMLFQSFSRLSLIKGPND
jgi:hypothetical protein